MNKRVPLGNERNLFLPALAGFFIAGVWLATRVAPGLWPLWILLYVPLLYLPLRVLHLPCKLLLLPVAFMLAMLWTMHWLNPPAPAAGKYDAITATVYGDSKITASGNVSFRLKDVTLDGKAQPGMAYATIYPDDSDAPEQLYDGQRIRFSGKVYHPYPKENEYDFNFPMWMYENGLHYGISGVQDVKFLFEQARWADYAGRIASACYKKLLPVMGERADLAVAMLLGESNTLAEDDYLAFQHAGVAHIMAVSGLHVGILSMALLWLLSRLRMRNTWQIPVVAVFLIGYCWVTGFAVSSMRAAVMVLLWVIAGAFGRKPNPITVVSAALLIVLIINPLQLFSAGFVLSFSAIGGLMLLYPRFMQGLDALWKPVKVKKEKKIRYLAQRFIHRLKQALAVTLAAQIGVLLPVAAYYHVMYPYSIVFNLLIVPVVSLLVPLFAITTLVVWIPWIGGWLGAVFGALASLGGETVLRLVRLSSALPLAQIRMAMPDAWVCVAALVCAITASHFIRASLHKRVIAIAAVIVIASTGSILTRPPALRYHQLSVGWADSALIVDHGVTIGIDTGNTGNEMMNRLLAEGRDLDALILTHLHSDHAGGVEAMLDDGVAIGHVYLPVDYTLHGYGDEILAVIQRFKDEGVPVTMLKAGDRLTFPETTIDVLWPQEGRTREGLEPNDRSMVTLITIGGVRILSMGDNGTLYEQYSAVPADILKVGHHGSREGTGDAFLQTVNPSLAVVSVRSNSLPAPSLLERLSLQGTAMLSTEDTGEITIVPGKDGYRAYRYIPEGTH